MSANNDFSVIVLSLANTYPGPSEGGPRSPKPVTLPIGPQLEDIDTDWSAVKSGSTTHGFIYRSDQRSDGCAVIKAASYSAIGAPVR